MFGKQSGGIFADGGALGELDSVSTEMNPDGMHYTVTCEVCGKDQTIIIGWDQMMALANLPRTRRVPIDPHTRAPWLMKDGRFYPQIGCISSACHKPIVLLFTPDEAVKNLNAAVAAGILQPRQ